MLRQKGQRWIDADFEGGGSAKNQLKDLNFIAAIAEECGLNLPLSSRIRSVFARMIHEGDGDLDHTGIYRTIAAGPAGTTAGTGGLVSEMPARDALPG